MKKLLIALLILGFAAPAMASDFYFYGKIRPQVGWYDTSSDYPVGSGPLMDTSISGPSDEGLMLDLSSSTRFGLKFVASETLSGVVEIGLDDDASNSLRLAWGEWDFGAGKLGIGQNYTPATFLGYSGMNADIGDGGYGNMLLTGMPYIGRKPQIRLSFGDFDLAFIEHHGVDGFSLMDAATDAAVVGPGGVAADKDFNLPRIEAAYVFDIGDVASIRPVAGFQTYKVEWANQDERVNSYLLGIGASLNFEPAYVKTSLSWLQNPNNYGDATLISGNSTTFQANSGFAWLVNGDVENSEVWKGTLVGGANFSKMFGLEAGIGAMAGETDFGPATYEETAYMYYLQARITPVEGLNIWPGIGMLDLDEDEAKAGGIKVSADRGDMVYANIAFSLDF